MLATFHCNLCSTQNILPESGFARDESSCTSCHSSVRMRGMLYALSMNLFGTPLSLPDFPALKSIRGLGMSDDEQYAAQLSSKFDNRNTNFERASFLDVVHPVEGQIGEYVFILCDDVVEHVAPPDRGRTSQHFLTPPHQLAPQISGAAALGTTRRWPPTSG
ncbi:MAG: hypothetical protein K1Y02_24005 [Candidatus Hydrogenedentes bacterium]|nr:hypothetical protein [Candidatus Hydrogenedentota bacterium]